MTASAERHTSCARGHRHWGGASAAGLLITCGDRVYLQRRSKEVDHPGTWSVPGGALAPGEDAFEGALREAGEELGPIPFVQPTAFMIDDHGGWAYYTVVVAVAREFRPRRPSWEDDGGGWFTFEQVARLPLHPHFARSFEELVA